MYSAIIKNGTIINGLGGKPFQADIAIAENKIVQIGDLQNAKAHEIIDASGKYVMPGFVDIQNHSDVYWSIWENSSLESLAAQGITSILVGSCGASLAPIISKDALLAVQKWHNLKGINVNWNTFAEYLGQLEKTGVGINVGSLVGYSTLRRGLVGDAIRSLTDREIKTLEKVLEQSLEEGAFGLSSGLSYAHEAIISESELGILAQVVKKYNALFSVHLRSETTEFTESVSEALDLALRYGVNLKISHFKARDKSNWHLLPQALNLIEDAYQKKGNVHYDVYPYDTMWQVLYTYLPKWFYEGGRQVMLEHLKDPIQRKKVLAYLMSRDVDYKNIYIAATSMQLNVIGKTLGEIASRHGISSEEALLTIVENGGNHVMVFDKNLNMNLVEQLMTHPLGMIATDGASFSVKRKEELVHPRCFGTMPKFLSMCIEKNLMPLEKAVQKITQTPANKIGLHKRGQLSIDYYADIVIMDHKVSATASYLNPYQYPKGIEEVFVNGIRVVKNNQPTLSLAGEVLRKNV